MALDKHGDVEYVQGSGSKPYELKNLSGVLSCTCPAWRNQGATIDKRTCKHLRKLRGAAVEEARIGGQSISVAVVSAPIQTQLVSPGCACERGSTCDVSHDPATCPCVQCTTAEKSVRKTPSEPPSGKSVPPVLLAHHYRDFPELNPTSWWVSEKLDGVRAYWDGKNFISRQGNIFHAPDWFKAGLPDHPLDGELWMGRRMFQKTLSVIRGDWKGVTYVVFDAPHLDSKFEQRFEFLEKWHETAKPVHAKLLEFTACGGRLWLDDELNRIVKQGAEGLMIREFGSLYRAGKSNTLLKVKLWQDAEAVVVAHNPGKGKFKGMLGGLIVKMPDGKTFNVGGGLEDSERRNPPSIGSTITYKYMDLTDDGIPKGASFVAVRDYE